MRSIPRVWEIGFQHVARRFGMGRRFKTKSPDEEASQSAAMYLGFLFISQFVQSQAIHVRTWPAVQRYGVSPVRAKSSVEVCEAAAPHEQHNYGSRGESHEVGSDAYRAGRLRMN